MRLPREHVSRPNVPARPREHLARLDTQSIPRVFPPCLCVSSPQGFLQRGSKLCGRGPDRGRRPLELVRGVWLRESSHLTVRLERLTPVHLHLEHGWLLKFVARVLCIVRVTGGFSRLFSTAGQEHQ